MTCRCPFQPKLFYDPMNPGKVSSKATFYFCASIFLPGISLASLFCLVRDVSHCPSLSCPTRWRPWPDSQGAITAVTSLWKTKEFLSWCTAGVINLNWSKQNNETQYHKRLLSFFPSYIAEKYLRSHKGMKNASGLGTAWWYLQEHIRYEKDAQHKETTQFQRLQHE